VRGTLSLGSPSAKLSLGWVLLVIVLAGPQMLVAQEAGATAEPEPASGDAAAGTTDANQPVAFLYPIRQRDAILGLAAWDHTLYGAFQLGAQLLHLSAVPITPQVLSFRRTTTTTGRFSVTGASPNLTLDEIAKALRMDQLQRQGMNVNFNSGLGAFRLQYREIFNGRSNSLGGGMGQASAAATYTSPRFGTGKLVDFSAAALMGTGSINSMLGNGFGTSAIGGNGPGHKSQTAPTVALKLTF
jgi:hypothetical protein